MKRIVAIQRLGVSLIAGFESFNANLYHQAGEMAMKGCEELGVIFYRGTLAII
ncbi:MAG: hypothetical protein AAGE96_17595 [Cyanobacteria bacterium P01_G01_bin.19]